MDKKCSVQIVTFNSRKFIENLFESIRGQSYKNIEIIVIDNGSTDNSIQLIKAYYPNIIIVDNKKNLGFCKGHNKGFQFSNAEYVLVLNPDVILDQYYIERVINYFELNYNVGMITGKVLRMESDFSKTDTIDSTGIEILPQRRGIDRGQTERDYGQYDQKSDIFGVSGAAAVYRRAMLEDIKVDNEYFDESFFAYKEDIDLSWRARLKGWECIYCPEAVAYHMRGWNEGNRKSQPLFIRVHSIKNRILMMLKNDSIVGILEHLPQILIYELAVFFYCLLFDFKALRYIIEVVKLLPQTLRKRKLIQSTRRVDDREIYKYFK